jgi:uncharacterized protein (UPF0335 family)
MKKFQLKAPRFLSDRRFIRPAFLLFAGLLAFAFGASVVNAQTVSGEWTAQYKTNKPNQVHFMFQRRTSGGGMNMNGDYLPLGELQGLSTEALTAARVDVKFNIVREAGTFACEGYFNNGRGVGFWTLAPSEKFVSAMRGRGYENLTDEDLTRAAFSNLTTAFVDELKSAGYDKLTFNETMRARNHDISAEYIRQVKAMGFGGQPLEKLIRLRNHDITPEFVNKMKSAGFENLSVEQLIRLQNHDITLEFINDLKAEGYANVSVETAIRLKNHDIDREFIQRAKAQGFPNAAPEELIRLKNRGMVK